MADLLAHHPPYARWAHVILRVMTGLFFAQHGAQKLFGIFGGMGGEGMTAQFGTLMWMAGVMEFFGGLIVAIGLFTKVVSFLLSGQMAVAYFKAHFPNGFWPIENGGELSALFCFIFLYFAATGAGAVSLDYILSRRKTQPVMP